MGLLELILLVLGFVVVVVAGFVLFAAYSSEIRQQDKAKTKVIGILLGIVGILLIFSTSFFVIVDAGTVGVQKTFGVVDNAVMEPGLHLKNPFTEIIPMNTRTQKYFDYGTTNDKASIVALSNDGLSTTMDIAVNYHLNPGMTPSLYNNVGTDYSNVVMVNPIHSVPRDLISKYDTKTLYSASKEGSTDRAKLETELFTGISARLNEIGVKDSIIIEQVSIRNIDFPQSYKDTITAKMNMDTDKQKKATEVDLQKLEADRVSAEAEGTASRARIEALGKADAARIEAQGIKDAADKIGGVSDQYLYIRFLQTIGENGKAIYVPLGQDGLPLIKTI